MFSVTEFAMFFGWKMSLKFSNWIFGVGIAGKNYATSASAQIAGVSTNRKFAYTANSIKQADSFVYI